MSVNSFNNILFQFLLIKQFFKLFSVLQMSLLILFIQFWIYLLNFIIIIIIIIIHSSIHAVQLDLQTLNSGDNKLKKFKPNAKKQELCK